MKNPRKEDKAMIDDELTEADLAELDAQHQFYARVHEFRAKRGETWLGPPMTQEEYAYARGPSKEEAAP